MPFIKISGLTTATAVSATNQLEINQNGASRSATLGQVAGLVTPALISAVPVGPVTTSGLTMATSRLLGRTTAGSGAPEEISVGTGLTLSGGSLSSGVTNRQVFDSSGTWTKPSGFAANSPVYIQVWAGGGSGGKGSTAGGGGGGGAYNERWTVLSALGATETVTVGTGGVGRIINSAGAAGGNSSFGALVTAFGGAGGSNLISSTYLDGGGGGGQLSAGNGGFPGRPLFFTGIAVDFGAQTVATLYQGNQSALANNANDALYHGGGGAYSGFAFVGGSSVWGGGGGGGNGSGTSNTAGTSSFGGNGGAGGTTGTAGTQPGGGGGGSTTGNSGSGGAGRVIIVVFPGA
jgi:hypothetical protein